MNGSTDGNYRFLPITVVQSESWPAERLQRHETAFSETNTSILEGSEEVREYTLSSPAYDQQSGSYRSIIISRNPVGIIGNFWGVWAFNQGICGGHEAG